MQVLHPIGSPRPGAVHYNRGDEARVELDFTVPELRRFEESGAIAGFTTADSLEPPVEWAPEIDSAPKTALAENHAKRAELAEEVERVQALIDAERAELAKLVASDRRANATRIKTLHASIDRRIVELRGLTDALALTDKDGDAVVEVIRVMELDAAAERRAELCAMRDTLLADSREIARGAAERLASIDQELAENAAALRQVGKAITARGGEDVPPSSYASHARTGLLRQAIRAAQEYAE